ncbi:MAG TPA: HD domain-containing phosphohydrolase [Candidatus Margulisiibacteriota bacterium]|nr:HD domain-containing phosphohydrolase [Candidatus Margulisiibacteriota bacterium]
MFENIEASFKEILASLQTAKLYGTDHPLFKKSCEKAFSSLKVVLRENNELVIGIVGEELAFEKEIFIELSRAIKPSILYLKERGIERISFASSVSAEEFEKFVVFLSARKEELKKGPQEYLISLGVRNITVGKLKGQASSATPPAGDASREEKGAEVSSSSIYESSLDNFSKSLSGILDAQVIDSLTFKFAINNVMEHLIKQHQEFLRLTTIKRYDPSTFVHLLNVSILAMHFASKMGFERNVILDIGVAALFHDIGKLYISRNILRKKDRLTDEEFGRITSHTVMGAQILLKYVDALGILPVVVAFEHHLKYNLLGYPKLSFGQKPNIASSMVSICDVYDALSERRGYKADYPPDVIYDIMMKEKGTSFDPQLVDKFFEFVGVWPIGSVVALSDGRVAVVADENSDDIFSPKVEVIHPEDKKEVINLKDTKGTLKVERYLNPWKEGKDFLHLISPKDH